MKALVKTQKGKGFVEVREVLDPSLGDDEVLIEVRACGICGTDLHVWHDEFPYWPPVILGHEYSGVITQVGKNVRTWKVGDRVVCEPHTKVCGVCYYCRTGNIQICPQKRPPGWGIDGAFAKYVKVPAFLLHRIPDNVSFEEAALSEPTAFTVHAVLERSIVEPGDFVVVLGPGPIGLLSASLAKGAGAAKVMITGINKDVPLRLRVAKELGIDYIVNVNGEDPVKKVMELTDGLGADLVVEASGSEQGTLQGVEMVRRLGRIGAVGLMGREKISFPWDRAVLKGITVIFNFSSKYTSWNKALAMMGSGKVNIKPLITHKMKLEEWEKAFNLLERGEAIKILLIPE